MVALHLAVHDSREVPAQVTAELERVTTEVSHLRPRPAEGPEGTREPRAVRAHLPVLHRGVALHAVAHRISRSRSTIDLAHRVLRVRQRLHGVEDEPVRGERVERVAEVWVPAPVDAVGRPGVVPVPEVLLDLADGLSHLPQLLPGDLAGCGGDGLDGLGERLLRDILPGRPGALRVPVAPVAVIKLPIARGPVERDEEVHDLAGAGGAVVRNLLRRELAIEPVGEEVQDRRARWGRSAHRTRREDGIHREKLTEHHGRSHLVDAHPGDRLRRDDELLAETVVLNDVLSVRPLGLEHRLDRVFRQGKRQIGRGVGSRDDIRPRSEVGLISLGEVFVRALPRERLATDGKVDLPAYLRD